MIDLKEFKKLYPKRMIIASIMPGAVSDSEMDNWCKLASACVDVVCDAIELNMSWPHMDIKDMGAYINNDEITISLVIGAVKKVVCVPIWVKLTPSNSSSVSASKAAYQAGASSISLCNTFPSLP